MKVALTAQPQKSEVFYFRCLFVSVRVSNELMNYKMTPLHVDFD